MKGVLRSKFTRAVSLLEGMTAPVGAPQRVGDPVGRGRAYPAVLAAMAGLLLLTLALPVPARADPPVSLSLAGWGWCPKYGEIADVSLSLDGDSLGRPDADQVDDLYLTGTLEFAVSGITETYDLELRGTRVRSLFFLKEVTGGDQPLVAEFEGFWLTENDYVACEGRMGVSIPNHTAKPYVFVLRTGSVDVPAREPGGWVPNIDFIIQKGVLCLDLVGDRLAEGGDVIKDLLASVLTKMEVLIREIRKLGIPYIQ